MWCGTPVKQEVKKVDNNIKKTEIIQQTRKEERALFHLQNAVIRDCVFEKGESPLKESKNIELDTTMFRWKYPVWYSNHVDMKNCTLFETARSGIWYTNDIRITDSIIEAPKTFRRGRGITLENVYLPNAEETFWNCENVVLKNVNARGNYFGFNTNHIQIDGLTLSGNYAFDGSHDVEMHNSRLLSKDAFWNTENVTVYDSHICGEYLGWNSKNLTLVNCTIESLQGLCYIDNLVMKNCRLLHTELAFEYASVDADIRGDIGSVLNPTSGTIKADHIGTLILQKDRIDPEKTHILCDSVDTATDDIDWQLMDD